MTTEEPMSEEMKKLAREVISIHLSQMAFVEDDRPLAVKLGIMLMIGALVKEGLPTKVALLVHTYLCEAPDKEIMSLFRNGTAHKAN